MPANNKRRPIGLDIPPRSDYVVTQLIRRVAGEESALLILS